VGLIRSPRPILGVNGHTKCGTYLLASSLAAALLDSLFEHPVWRPIAIVIANVLKNETSAHLESFQQTPSPS